MNYAWIKSEFMRHTSPNVKSNENSTLHFSSSFDTPGFDKSEEQGKLFSRTQSAPASNIDRVSSNSPFKTSLDAESLVHNSLYQEKNGTASVPRSEKMQTLSPIWWTPV